MGTFFGMLGLLAIVLIIIALIKNDGEWTIFVGIVAIAIVLVVFIYGIFSWGYVTSQFYDWFVLRYYPKLPHFTVYQFIGFNFVLSTIIRNYGTSDIKEEFKKDKVTLYCTSILSPWLVLLFGYIFMCWFL